MKTGLALSGGGIRGLSHLGLLKALSENGISIDHISGTSAGAIVAAFYAAGLSPEQILELVLSVKPVRFIRPALTKDGFFRMEPVRELFEKHLPVKYLEELRIPVTISATRIRDAKTCYFSTGAIAPLLAAASAVPVLLMPVHIDDEAYIDGGIVNNLPVEPLEDCDKIIGSLCNPIDENFQVKNIRTLIERTLLIAVNTNTYSRRTKCDIIFEPEGLKPMRVFSLSHAEDIFRIGYEHALGRIDEIRRTLQ